MDQSYWTPAILLCGACALKDLMYALITFLQNKLKQAWEVNISSVIFFPFLNLMYACILLSDITDVFMKNLSCVSKTTIVS